MRNFRKRIKVKKNKIILICVIVLMLLILIVSGWVVFFRGNENKRKVLTKKEVEVVLVSDLSVEINSEVNLLSFVEEVLNGEMISEDSLVDTSSLGSRDLKLLVKDEDGREEEVVFQINVIDTEKPIISGKGEVSTYVGNGINLLDGVTVTDNSLENISAIVIGKYNFNVVGDYSLSYVAKDSSGNETVSNFVLKVMNDPNNYTFTTSKGYTARVINGVTYINGILIVNKTYNLPSSYGNGLTSETQSAFNKMKADAISLGLNLVISSGYRTYYDQRYIYNNYVALDGKEVADTYSARAGHSEHQTGLAFDLNSIDDSFTNTPEGKWVHDNCYRYGLILRYPKGKENITGYMHESWHLRYVGVELANKLYNNGDWITLEEYFGIDSKYSY